MKGNIISKKYKLCTFTDTHKWREDLVITSLMEYIILAYLDYRGCTDIKVTTKVAVENKIQSQISFFNIDESWDRF
jgi:hypothetical protein